jgi:hypothetical protein
MQESCQSFHYTLGDDVYVFAMYHFGCPGAVCNTTAARPTTSLYSLNALDVLIVYRLPL